MVDTLPVKLKADLAVHFHVNTLSKVALFKVSYEHTVHKLTDKPLNKGTEGGIILCPS